MLPMPKPAAKETVPEPTSSGPASSTKREISFHFSDMV
jgi:hypothetical protein